MLKTKGSWVDWLVFKNTRLPVVTVSHSSEARKSSLEGFELEFCWEFIIMVPFIEKNKCLSPFLGPHSTNFFSFFGQKTSQKTSLNIPKNESELKKSYRVWAQKVYSMYTFWEGWMGELHLSKTRNMSSNTPDSFFGTPTSTPPVKLGEKASWEITTVEDRKMTAEEAHDKLLADLMADSSDSDTAVKIPRKLSPEALNFYKAVTNHSWETDSSEVEVLDNKQVQQFQAERASKQAERAAKRQKFIELDRKKNATAKVAMFVPQILDTRLIFIRDHFIGPVNYNTSRAVDKYGVVYKRAVLKDGTLAHNFIVSAEQLLFKIDGEDVQHKTPGARGIVNITRTNRVPFSKLFAHTFDNDL